MKLYLACGKDRKEGFHHVDIAAASKPDEYADILDENWWKTHVWDVKEIEEIYVSHFLEHIPHLLRDHTPAPDRQLMRDGLIRFMEWCWRALVPGGLMTVVFPHHHSDGAFADPTHRRFISVMGLRYFDAVRRAGSGVDHYGINADFEILSGAREVLKAYADHGQDMVDQLAETTWNVVQQVTVQMVAHKPMRVP